MTKPIYATMKNDERLYWKAKMRTTLYRKSRAEKEEGDIVLRIEIPGSPRAEFRTGIRAKFHEWDAKKKRFGVFSEKIKTYQRLLDDIEECAFRINNVFFDNDIESTPAKVIQVLTWVKNKRGESYHLGIKLPDVEVALKLRGEPVFTPVIVRPKLMDVIKDLKNYLELSEKTKGKYVSAENCLEKYLTHIKRVDIAAEDFTTEQATLMTDHLRKQKKRPLARVTIKRYVNQYVKALKEAKRRGLIKINHLADFEYKGQSEKDYKCLDRKQVWELITLPNLSPKHIALVDAFVFMIKTGMHYIDYINLTKDDIKIRHSKNKKTGETKTVYWLEKKREKSKVEYCQKMDMMAVQIISKYGCPENMPKFRYDWMRNNLLKLGKMTSYGEGLTSKRGRKTAANEWLNLRDRPMSKETAALSLGLLRTDTIDYYAKVNRQRVENELNYED